MDTIDSEHRIPTSPRQSEAPRDSAAAKAEPRLQEVHHSDSDGSSIAVPERSVALKWFLHDILFIAMLALTLIGVIFRLPITYWVILTPLFGIISVIEGWKHFVTRGERLGLVYRLAAIWCALLLAIYLIHNGGVQGEMNANSTSLAVITLLALGTVAAGIQARVWQICAVGGILFATVPGLGWLDQSPLLLAAVTVLIVTAGGLVWWASQRAD